MIRIDDLSLTYRSASVEHHAVRGVSIELAQAEFYTLLGPSGCGKTTTLRCVAGLERPDAGEIIQEGSPREIYAAPKGSFVADFIGRTNFLEGNVRTIEDDAGISRADVETPIGMLNCRVPGGASVGGAVKVAVRPENVELGAPGAALNGNAVEGEVESVIFLGNLLDCAVNVGGQSRHVQLHPVAPPALDHRVVLYLPPEHLLAMRS